MQRHGIDRARAGNRERLANPLRSGQHVPWRDRAEPGRKHKHGATRPIPAPIPDAMSWKPERREKNGSGEEETGVARKKPERQEVPGTRRKNGYARKTHAASGCARRRSAAGATPVATGTTVPAINLPHPEAEDADQQPGKRPSRPRRFVRETIRCPIRQRSTTESWLPGTPPNIACT